MVDKADEAKELDNYLLDIALKNAKNQPRLKPKGICYNCREPLEHPKESFFCDADCREDYEKRTRR